MWESLYIKIGKDWMIRDVVMQPTWPRKDLTKRRSILKLAKKKKMTTRNERDFCGGSSTTEGM